ncbi:serine hydrolase domain-containing protein [Wenyingzhuangia fucanilytica]|uniref:serine hydrolase domain-containing protein n=1 Tax=Wenyingzhuangia fucanilytica TaxID=1790137 RepID=UPI00083A4EA5|nr:serine hydrolase [Wenyingzhuangia fucanilytica]
MKTLKMIGFTSLFIVLIIIFYNAPKLKLISGFAAKNLASSFFIANRSEDYTNKTDNSSPLIKLANSKINLKEKIATSNVWGFAKEKAVYRDGIGAILVNKDTVLTDDYLKPNRNLTSIPLPYPYGNLPAKDTIFNNVDYQLLNNVINNSFVGDYKNKPKNTRSLIVLYKGQIIAEKYADGFDKNSLLQGWSITKSLLTTCFGILEKDGDFDINQPITAFSDWLKDDRKNITTSQLLRMESGLEWEENYSTICDVTKMLFKDNDLTKRPLSKKQTSPAETVFNYSSGTSNILSALLRKQFNTHQEYLDFPYQEFIDKIGMHSMLMETDIMGNYVASSYSWATTRDWAKFGQLMLNDGIWNGEQIVSKKWVNYITTPNKTSNNEYGGHWWLNKGDYMPNVPKDCFYADGFQGQRIFVIPSKELVVVRFGVTELNRTEFYTMFDHLLKTICKSIQ